MSTSTKNSLSSPNNLKPASDDKEPPLLSDKKEKLVGKLHSLINQLDKCCKCSEAGVKPSEEAKLPDPPCVRTDFKLPGYNCRARPCTPTGPTRFGLKPRPPFRDIPLGGRRSVPFEIDFENYPLITTNATRETRFISNKNGVGDSELGRKDVRYCMRPWLPEPVDLGGNGTAWDLRRYPSKELIEGQVVMGCDCRKTNGLQDQCMRQDCRGAPACLRDPPVCKPSGGPGPSALCQKDFDAKKRHKNNCWCPECRPSCLPHIPERLLQGRCAECVARDEPICGSKCDHYCKKHMGGVKEIEVPPLMA